MGKDCTFYPLLVLLTVMHMYVCVCMYIMCVYTALCLQHGICFCSLFVFYVPGCLVVVDIFTMVLYTCSSMCIVYFSCYIVPINFYGVY